MRNCNQDNYFAFSFLSHRAKVLPSVSWQTAKQPIQIIQAAVFFPVVLMFCLSFLCFFVLFNKTTNGPKRSGQLRGKNFKIGLGIPPWNGWEPEFCAFTANRVY